MNFRFYLDLVNLDQDGQGMEIISLSGEGPEINYTHKNNRILFRIPLTDSGTVRSFRIEYQGIPSDGLIIAKNKFGDRTFFGDNWPNRARHWLPVVDHPSDKATVEFLVEAPGHYRIVSNGSKIAEYTEGGRIVSHWQTTVPLPTRLMVIGVSPFEVQRLESASGIPVSAWVYPQNKEEGFDDYSMAIAPLDFFEGYIAPYPYSKLANVQSKTRYGGMENASCIFYHEQTVTGKRDQEALIAHEIAHQWYGDAVTEKDWHHIWLSEGFATYLADMYLEHEHGREVMVESMLDEKQLVLEYAAQKLAPIVDTTLTVSISLLNNNSYDKAAWVLHMLRRDLGDELFQCCVRTFYNKYKFSNALTEDFRSVVETLSGRDFRRFFKQWFYTPGHPVLSINCNQTGEEIQISIRQHQEQHLFEFPLEIRIEMENGTAMNETLHISKAQQTHSIRIPGRPIKVVADPESWLLFELYDSP